MTTAQIQIPDIEGELNRIWESPEAKDKIRANLFTLIIYASDDRRARLLNNMVDAILERFPCRVIFIQGNEALDSDYLTVSVSTVKSSKKEAQALIACDQITINAGYKKLNRVPFLVLPHLLPDLPVHLLWGQDPTTEHEIFPRLQHFASRVIFDSDWISDLQVFSETILELLRVESVDILDINWALLFGWRDVIGKIFHTCDGFDHICRTKTMVITYNSRKADEVRHPEIQAIYLQGWIAGQLGWSFKSLNQSGDSKQLIYNNGVHDIVVTLFPQPNTETQPGTLLSLDISTTSDLYYLLSRKLNQSKVVVHISTLEKCELPLNLPLPDTKHEFTFLKEIFYYGTSQHYCKMLEMLQKINWQGYGNQ